MANNNGNCGCGTGPKGNKKGQEKDPKKQDK